MTAPVLQLPIRILRSHNAGQRPGDGTFRALTDGEEFSNLADRVKCYLDASGNLVTYSVDPNVYAALAPLASPAFTGTPTAPTASAGDSSTKLATTAFVAASVSPFAPLASPALTGTPTAPTQAAADNSTRLATTAYADRAATNAQMVAVGNAPVKSVVGQTGTITLAMLQTGGVAAQTQVVRNDAAQSPTAAQQAQSLANIGLAGVVAPYAGSAAPAGWLLCAGQNVSRTTYAKLYAAIGTTFGAGDGSTTFGLPDLRGRAVFGLDSMGGSAAGRLTVALSGLNGTTLGAAGGDQALQSHGHTITSSAGYKVYGGNATTSGPASGNGFNTDLSVVNTATAGLGGAGNVPPAIVLNYIICAGA